jgi:hypothetical protein
VPGDEGANAYVILKKKDVSEVDQGEKRKEMSENPEYQTKDPSTQKDQAKKDEAQKQGKAGDVRTGANRMRNDEKSRKEL